MCVCCRGGGEGGREGGGGGKRGFWRSPFHKQPKSIGGGEISPEVPGAHYGFTQKARGSVGRNFVIISIDKYKEI